MSLSFILRSLAAVFAGLCLFVVTMAAPAVQWFMENRHKVASHWDPLDPLDLTAPSTFVQRWKIERAMADGALCRAAITRAGVAASPRDDVIRSENCRLVDTVALRALGGVRLSKIQTKCRVALSLFLWQREVVQPAAKRFFGEPVVRLRHLGSYSCRRIAGTLRWSQHAQANAVDISGFALRSGKTISVLRDWPKDTDAARFLRVVRAGACDHFAMVLGPDFNAAHKDHFHFDHGWWSGCK